MSADKLLRKLSGQKPIMGLVRQSDIQPFANRAVSMLERGFIDLARLADMNGRLADLRWLYTLWKKLIHILVVS